MSTTNTNTTSTGACSSGGGGSGSGGSGPCGACKFLRRKCVAGCIFAPYFDSEQGAAHFAAVHKVFGGSNASKLLLRIPVHKRVDAVVTICYEAQARLRDPIYGCVAHIFALQQQVVNLQAELSYLQAHLTTLELPSPPPPPPLLHQTLLQQPPSLSIADLPTASAMPATCDLSSLFDPTVQQSTWAIMPVHQQQQRPFDHHIHHHTSQFGSGNSIVRPQPSDHIPSSSGGGDFQTLASELLHGHSSSSTMHVPCTEGSPS